MCVCVYLYLQQHCPLGAIPGVFCLVLTPMMFLHGTISSPFHLSLLNSTGHIFLWPLSQMGSCLPPDLVSFLCPSLKSQVLDTQSCSLNVEESPFSAADTAVPLRELSSM